MGSFKVRDIKASIDKKPHLCHHFRAAFCFTNKDAEDQGRQEFVSDHTWLLRVSGLDPEPACSEPISPHILPQSQATLLQCHKLKKIPLLTRVHDPSLLSHWLLGPTPLGWIHPCLTALP